MKEQTCKNLIVIFLHFSNHKVFGPMGIGVLFGKEQILNELPPYQGGGDMIEEVQFGGTTYASVPSDLKPARPMLPELSDRAGIPLS